MLLKFYSDLLTYEINLRGVWEVFIECGFLLFLGGRFVLVWIEVIRLLKLLRSRLFIRRCERKWLKICFTI